MSVPIVIAKNRDLPKSQDYDSLREQGLDYVRNLSGKIWTDHNLHDPGITTLEMLCYALTDLGYRTGFETKDLLTSETGEADLPEESGLFPAHEVMTTAPLTIFDYRRLLLKIEGVRNAWLDPMTDPDQEGNYKESEIPIYADCHAGGLSFDAVNALGNDNHHVRLSGLYKVLLELEIDDELGSLNETRLVYQVKRGPLKGVVLAIDSRDPAFFDGVIGFDEDFQDVLNVGPVVPDGETFEAEVDIELADASSVTLEHLVIAVINDRPESNEDPIPVTGPDLGDLLGDDQADGIIPLFWAKQQARTKALARVCCVLDAHRDLCEDFLSIETVAPERVAVCADIELTGEADIEEVQARVFHAIEQYFNPPIRYFTLAELLDEGLCADEIFNGPYIDTGFTCGGEPVFTKPGFIKTGNLEESELRRVIYVSDIINILMDFEDIVSIRNVMLRRYDADGNPVGDSEKWCLEITPTHQPVLFIVKSKLLFFKNETPFRARSNEFQKTLDHLRAMARKAAYVEPNQVLELPRGRYRNPDRYFSIQHDYPNTYGIGEAGLPGTAAHTRVAQARQLKAYLTFYDQILADYLSQLAHVRKLFSLDKTLARTYFSQYLSEIAGVRDAFEDEFYIDKTVLQDDAQRTLLTEDEALFQSRRNRFLDHLTARFAEQFTDYVMMMFTLDGDPLKTGEELIDDKIDFLREYPIVSRERNKAFNYRPEDPNDLWDTVNVSGVEKRVSRLVGIGDYSRRNLACEELFDELFNTRKIGNDFRVEIKDRDNAIIFKSKEVFPDRDLALAEARKLYPFIRHESTYQVDDSGGTGQVFYTINAAGASLENDALFDTEADAVQSIREIIDRYDEILQTSGSCNDEGFHLFEHILLRPFTDQDDLMDVCLDDECESCGDEDPYSFRITVVLPYWPARFQRFEFRRHFERTLRKETPAHIHARICWIGNDQMSDLDEKYRAWIDAKSTKDHDQTALTAALRELIEILQSLHTVYPAATLHDCDEGGDENPVRLGNTNLGIF